MTDSKFPETIDEIMDDPSKYGLPTLDQFCANPDQYRLSPENLLETVDKGSKIFTQGMSKHTYEIAGYRARTLEEVQMIAMSEGLDMKKMTICPIIIPGPFGQSSIHVRFVQKGRTNIGK